MLNRPMRRKDRKMSEENALAVLDQGAYITLSMASNQASPYAVPLSFARVDFTLYFHCALQGLKLDILRENPQVCGVVVQPGSAYFHDGDFTTSFESVIVFGTAREVADPNERMKAMTCICDKYLPDHHDDIAPAMDRAGARTGIWAIDISSITGKVHE